MLSKMIVVMIMMIIITAWSFKHHQLDTIISWSALTLIIWCIEMYLACYISYQKSLWRDDQRHNKSCVYSLRYQQANANISPANAGHKRRKTNPKASFFNCSSSSSRIRLAECDSSKVTGSLQSVETSPSTRSADFVTLSTSQLVAMSCLMTAFSEALTAASCPTAGFAGSDLEAGKRLAKRWAWRWGNGGLWHSAGLMYKHIITITTCTISQSKTIARQTSRNRKSKQATTNLRLMAVFHVNLGWPVPPPFSTWVDQFSSSTCSRSEPSGLMAKAFLWGGRPSCHATNSVRALKEMCSTELSQWPILSSLYHH